MQNKLILYTQKDLEYIREQLRNGVTKFTLREFRCYFGKQGDMFIQRIDNFMLGLTYNLKDDYFIFNFPHLPNIREGQTPIDAYYQQKENGTNLGEVIPYKLGFIGNPCMCRNYGYSIVWRCRGSINPDSFMNDINKRVALGDTNHIGINPEIFASFVNTYKPIFEMGKSSGLIDDFGNFKLSKITPELTAKTKELFFTEKNKHIIGLFGELVSKYNPIAVDGELKFGMYQTATVDYEWIIFDYMYEDTEGNICLDYNVDWVNEYGLQHVTTIPLVDMVKCLERFPTHEGIIIKGWNNQYLKMKHEDVITWAREMSKLPTIMDSAISHLFEQGLGFSKEDVLTNLVLKDRESIESIIKLVWEEINSNGVNRANLEEYYIARKMLPSDVDRDMNNKLSVNLMMLVASVLKENGVGKETLYLELPKYLTFERDALFYDDKKKKWRANMWYGKMLGTTIGRCYLK